MIIHPRQVLSAFGWSFVQSWGSQLTKLGVFIVLARLLDPRDIGLVAFAMVFIQGAQSFALTGVSDALIQKKDLSQETINAVFWLNMLIATTLAVVLFFAAPFLQVWFKMEGLASVLRWVCPVLLLQALAAVQMAQFQRRLEMRPLALRELFSSLLGGLAGVAAALQGWGVYALVINTLSGTAIGAVLLWSSSDWRPSLAVRWQELKSLLSFASSRTGSTVLAFMTTRLDDLFVGVFLGPVALGYYAVAYRILRSINQVATAVLGRAAFPLFSRLQQDPQRLHAAFRQVTRAGSTISFGLFGALFVMAPQLIVALFGAQWTPSIIVMQVLCLAGIGINLLNLNRAFLRATGHAGAEFHTFLVQGALCGVGFYAAAQRDTTAVAAVLAGVIALMTLIVLILNRKLVGVGVCSYIGSLVPPALAATAAAAASMFITRIAGLSALWPSMLLACSVFATFYGVFALLASRRDLLLLRELLRSVGKGTGNRFVPSAL
jgi:O-antigen/teichoic acid export membrane protein